VQWMVILSGLSELALALGLGFFVAYFGYRIFDRVTRRIDESQELERGNVAAAILSAAFIFSLGYLLRSVIGPMNETFFGALYLVSEGRAGGSDLLIALLAMAGQFLAALAVATLTILGSVRGFIWLTEIDELAQIRQGNVAVAIVVASLAITFAVLLEHGLAQLLQVIVPAPEIQNELLRPFG